MISFAVADCGGASEATTDPASISLPEFPNYPMQCVWNISTRNELSRINISLTDYLEPWERSPYCRSVMVVLSTGKYDNPNTELSTSFSSQT